MLTATERVEARVSREQKKLFQRAAELRGITLTDFLIGALQDAASRTIEEHASMKLTMQEQKTFVYALMNPPAPNDALRKASERHRKLVQ